MLGARNLLQALLLHQSPKVCNLEFRGRNTLLRLKQLPLLQPNNLRIYLSSNPAQTLGNLLWPRRNHSLRPYLVRIPETQHGLMHHPHVKLLRLLQSIVHNQP